jgi:hypothetical protein
MNFQAETNEALSRPSGAIESTGITTQTRENNLTEAIASPESSMHLSRQAKKNNHKESERKRRDAIQSGFDELASLIPGMANLARSEEILLRAATAYIDQEIQERRRLVALAEANEIDTTGFLIPDEVGFTDDEREFQNPLLYSFPTPPEDDQSEDEAEFEPESASESESGSLVMDAMSQESGPSSSTGRVVNHAGSRPMSGLENAPAEKLSAE